MTAETRAPAVELVPLVAPDDVDAPEAADFRTMVDIRNRVHDFVYGTQATVITPAQAVPAWREQTDEEIHGFLIRERGEADARMKSRMSTDAPVGDMVWDEETWDAARVARVDARMVAQGFTGLIGAIEHLATGELVAYNELYHLGDPRHPTTQNDTLVLREHRGHRLGMLVKCENLLRWREIMPESTKVMTNNAEENRPMLDINEAMGFVPIAYGGAWQKTVS